MKNLLRKRKVVRYGVAERYAPDGRDMPCGAIFCLTAKRYAPDGRDMPCGAIFCLMAKRYILTGVGNYPPAYSGKGRT